MHFVVVDARAMMTVMATATAAQLSADDLSYKPARRLDEI